MSATRMLRVEITTEMDRLLGELRDIGIFGSCKAEVARRLIEHQLWDIITEEFLRKARQQ